MSQQNIDVGVVANDGLGDPLRDAFIKTNSNFGELYNLYNLTGFTGGNTNILFRDTGTTSGYNTDTYFTWNQVAHSLYINGSVGFSTTPNLNYVLNISKTFDGSVSQRGLSSLVFYNPTSNSSTIHYGSVLAARKSGDYNVGNIHGVYSAVGFSGNNGIINNAYASSSHIAFYTNSTGATITNAYSYYAEYPIWTVTGSTITNMTGVKINNMANPYITNSYGVYIDNQSGSITNTYALYSNGGKSYFKDKVSIGIVSSTYNLEVYGTGSTDGIRSHMGYDIYQVPSPTTLSGVVSAGGSVDTGTHYYWVTFVTNFGETNGKLASVITTTAGNNTVTLTIPISTDPRVTSRKIYRSKAGQLNYQSVYMVTVDDNIDTTYVDTAADSTLVSTVTVYYRVNTTNNFISVNGTRSLVIDINNTSLGYNAGNSITNGGTSTLIGSRAGFSQTTANENVAVGQDSLYSVTTGGKNTGIGALSMGQLIDGINNVAVGKYSVYGNINGSYNTGLGMNTGYANNTSNNIYLGYYAGGFETIGSKLFIDSFNRSTESAGRTNSIIYGVMSSTATNQILSLGGGGQVGINNITPTAFLHLPSGTTSTSPLKFSAGPVLGTTESGSVEYDGSHLYFTAEDAGSRYQLDQQTGTGVPYSGATGSVDLGNNNLTIDTKLLFVNTTSNQVGVNTNTFLDTYAGMQIQPAKFGQTIAYFYDPNHANCWWEIRNSGATVRGGYEIWSGVMGIGAYSSSPIDILMNDNGVARWTTTGRFGVGAGVTAPTAWLQIKAGASTASSAPLKFTSGTNLATTEAGAIEFDGTHLYFTATNGGTRVTLDVEGRVSQLETDMGDVAAALAVIIG